MKKLCLVLSATLCAAAVFGSFAAFADTAGYKLLTLEEARALALKNNVQYRSQDSYINEAQEEYDELNEDSSGATGKGTAAEKSSAQISYRVQLENAAYSVHKAVLSKEDLKRTSDYEVTDYFYTVIEAQNSVTDSERDMEQKKKSLDIAQFKYELDLITRSSLNQAQEELASSKAAYNKAVLELEKCVLQLGNSIGQELDLSTTRLDTSISIPDISGITLDEIKEDNLKNNLTYLNSAEQYKLAKYELELVQEKFDYYVVYKGNLADSVEERFDDMLYNADKAFDDAEYSYNEKLEELEDSVKDQYDSLTDLYLTYEDEKEELEDAKLEVSDNRIKLQLGLITGQELESSLAELGKLENRLYSTKANIVRQYMKITQYRDQ